MASLSLIGNTSGQPIDFAHQLEESARALHVLHEPQHVLHAPKNVLYVQGDPQREEGDKMAGWPQVLHRALRYDNREKITPETETMPDVVTCCRDEGYGSSCSSGGLGIFSFLLFLASIQYFLSFLFLTSGVMTSLPNKRSYDFPS